MRVYLETSAAAKLIVEEAESRALAGFCARPDVELVSTLLLDTELHRLAWRHALNVVNVDAVLGATNVYALPPAAYRQAGRLPTPNLRSLDALHVAGALLLAADLLLAYDRRQIAAAAGVGLTTASPGWL